MDNREETKYRGGSKMTPWIIHDSITGECIGPFNDYESAQMYMVFYSDTLIDGGSNLTLEPLTEPEAWMAENSEEYAEIMNGEGN